MRWVAGAFLGIGLAVAACGGSSAPGASGADAGSGNTGADSGSPDAGADAGPSADCIGLLPGPLGSALTFDVPQSAGKICAAAASDGTGMMVAEAHDAGTAPAGSDPVTWQTFDSRGAPQGNFAGSFALAPQATGYEGYFAGSATYWDSYGNPVYWPIEARAIVVPAFASGAIAFGAGASGIVAHRLDAKGAETARADGAQSGAFTVLGGAEDQAGAAVALFAAGGPLRFMWFDFANGKGDASADLGVAAHDVLARPLLGGGVAVRLDGHWTWTLHPHDANLYLPPSWLRDGTDFAPVRGGKAYAVWKSSANAVDLVLPRGDSCGTVTFPGVTGVSLGADGTVIGSSGAAGCTKVFWRSALR